MKNCKTHKTRKVLHVLGVLYFRGLLEYKMTPLRHHKLLSSPILVTLSLQLLFFFYVALYVMQSSVKLADLNVGFKACSPEVSEK